MRAEKNEKIILSIETVVEGGSLSVFVNGKEVGDWCGQGEVSKAEEILEQLQKLFDKHKIEKEFLSLIAVSSGPGSSTGIKIGLSLAKGLAKSIGCPMIVVSALASLTSLVNVKIAGNILTAVPIGKNLISWQIFENKDAVSRAIGDFQISDLESFIEKIKAREFSRAVLHNRIYEVLKEKQITKNNKLVMDAGKNLASKLIEKTNINYVR